MSKTVIVINGQGGNGKDFVVKAAALKFKVRNISVADIPKAMAKIGGWDGKSKDDASREFLSDILVAVRKYNQYCNKDAIRRIKEFSESDDEIIFVHIREPQDIIYVKQDVEKISGLKVKTLLVLSPAGKRTYGNIGDDSVFNYEYDYEYINDKSLSIDESQKKIINLIDAIINDQKICGSCACGS